MLKFSNQRKILFWSLIGFFQLTTDGREPNNAEQSSSQFDPSSDSRLEVRTRFPQYRVYYSPSQTAQEVLDEKTTSKTEKETKKEGS